MKLTEEQNARIEELSKERANQMWIDLLEAAGTNPLTLIHSLCLRLGHLETIVDSIGTQIDRKAALRAWLAEAEGNSE